MVEFVSDRMSYLTLRGHWYYILVLNVHAAANEITADMKESLYVERERMFDKFPKYHMKNLFRYFNAKVGKEDIYKQTIEN
jgi:hypothetical protein